MKTKANKNATYLLKHEDGTSFPPNQTALLVIDPVNDFLSEGGAAYEMTKTTLKMNNVIENLKKAIEGARERNIPVLFGPMAYTEEDYSEHELHRKSGINRMMFEHKMFLAGSWGADFHPDLQPQDNDIVLLPHKSIDVFETDLPEHLERMGITHLVIAGMAANLCCEGTGRHAMERGYDVTFLSNAIGSEDIPSYEASIHINYPLIGNGVLEVQDFLDAIDASSVPRVSVQEGDKVFGSDHGEIGKVKEVKDESEDARAHMKVPRGAVFTQDIYIPLDAVVRRFGTHVFINIPKILVSKMNWENPPSADDRRSKLGPPAGSTDGIYGSRSPSSHTHSQAASKNRKRPISTSLNKRIGE